MINVIIPSIMSKNLRVALDLVVAQTERKGH
jgi:hypothetical protein